MKYASVCSGIEAATVAWHPLGWQPAFFSEIEKFPSAVLAHHYPHVENRGDITAFKDWPDDGFDLLVGGTPCQSFSVAGLRQGLADPRGNLMLTYLAIADRFRPSWLVWENVPGVLSSNDGGDFASLIQGMAELGYHAAWRVLDAQYVRVDGLERAVPQRRRRLFVVGYLGDWRRAAAVLFERESLSGNTAPRREAGQGTSATVAPSLVSSGRGVERSGETRGQDPVVAVSVNDISRTLNAGGMGRQDWETETLIAAQYAPTLTATDGSEGRWLETEGALVAHALRDEGFDGSEDGTGRGTPLVPVSFGGQMSTPMWDFDLSQTLQAKNPQAVATDWAVRRLMPVECERLQGFPDGYTAIPYRNGIAADGPRYKALGNSMAINVMRWIGRRIDYVNTL